MLYNRRKSVVIVKVTNVYLNYHEENSTYEEVGIQNSSRRSGSSSFII
jgi:hypothetical protein